jgi:hypothetical protein
VQRWLDDLERGEPPARCGGMPIGSPVAAAVARALSSMGPGGEGAAHRLLDEVQALRWKTVIPALQMLADLGPRHASLRQVEAVGVDELQRAAPPENARVSGPLPAGVPRVGVASAAPARGDRSARR